MQQTSKSSSTQVSDSEKLEVILKQLELLTQQVEEIRKEVKRTGEHFQPLMR